MIRYETCFWKTTGGLLESASLYWLYKFWALFSLSVYAKPSEKTTTETTTTNIDPGRKVGIIMILHKNPIHLLERRKILRKMPNKIKMKKLCWCCSELTKKIKAIFKSANFINMARAWRKKLFKNQLNVLSQNLFILDKKNNVEQKKKIRENSVVFSYVWVLLICYVLVCNVYRDKKKILEIYDLQ